MLSSDINVKDLALNPYCGVGVCMCLEGEGGQSRVITIQKSTMTPLSVTVFRTCDGVCVWGGSVVTNANFTLTTRVGTCVPLMKMEMSTDVK